MLKIGTKLPTHKLWQWVGGKPSTFSTAEYFAGKKVVLFSLPGAFTPVCSARHLPEFDEKAGEFFTRGVGKIACLSVNDPYVMEAWRQQHNVSNVDMLCDPDGEYAKMLGLDLFKDFLGMRIERTAMIVDNGEVTEFEHDESALEKTSAASMLLKL